MACLFTGLRFILVSFHLVMENTFPDAKSIRDLDPDKLGCTTSSHGDETDPTFLGMFSGFLAPNFCN